MAFDSNAFDVNAFSELAFLFDGTTPTPTPTVESSSGGWEFFFRFDQERSRKRRRREEIEEAEEAVQQIPNEVDREIAQLLQKQEREDERRAEIERLRGLVSRYADAQAERAMTERARAALARVRERQSISSLVKLEKELRKQMEDEEMAILLMLIND